MASAEYGLGSLERFFPGFQIDVTEEHELSFGQKERQGALARLAQQNGVPDTDSGPRIALCLANEDWFKMVAKEYHIGVIGSIWTTREEKDVSWGEALRTLGKWFLEDTQGSQSNPQHVALVIIKAMSIYANSEIYISEDWETFLAQEGLR